MKQYVLANLSLLRAKFAEGDSVVESTAFFNIGYFLFVHLAQSYLILRWPQIHRKLKK